MRTLLACTSFILLASSSMQLGLETAHYTRPLYCREYLIRDRHLYHQQTTRSRLECAARCRQDDRCKSFLFDAQNKQCRFTHFVTTDYNCSQMLAETSGFWFYQRTDHCFNNGSLTSNGTCICPLPYYGSMCLQAMEDCQDVYDHRFQDIGVYVVHPISSPDPFPVFCIMLRTGKGRTTLMMHTVANYTFNRSWTEYEEGFGDVEGDHWLGLRRLHQLTSTRTYSLRFVLTLANGTKLYPTYGEFGVLDVSTGYTQRVDRSPSAFQDCLTPLMGYGFSTYDSDNDGAPDVNCAAVHGGGWWYNRSNCNDFCSPLGPLLNSSDERNSDVSGKAFWYRSNGEIVVPVEVSAFLLN